MKKLSENSLITELARQFQGSVPAGHIGIGDDCALIPNDGTGWLVSTDLLAEGVHFLKNRIKPRDLGWKSLAVNLSDLASKGGSPAYAFLSIAVEKNTDEKWINEFFAGFSSLARMSGTILLGGDTSSSLKGCFINVLVIGRAPDNDLKLRAHAWPGDLICVTGTLGDSAAGLKLQSKKTLTPAGKKLVARHHHPEPHLSEGKFLALQPGVRAMMDLSDGLDTDLTRILEASRMGACVETGNLPLSPELVKTSRAEKWKPAELALTGGEDYGLLFTVDPKEYTRLGEEFRRSFKTPLTRVGVIEEGAGIRYVSEGEAFTLKSKGFAHF